jgi:hypothetical protein
MTERPISDLHPGAYSAGSRKRRSFGLPARLDHDFVVLGLSQAPLPAHASRYETSLSIPNSERDVERLALALWVSGKNAQAPIQATGGWLE